MTLDSGSGFHLRDFGLAIRQFPASAGHHALAAALFDRRGGNAVAVRDTLNIMSMIGVILLMGLVTKNAILLIDYSNLLRREGMKRYDALITAARTRLRPIVMTTLAMIFGMLPLAFEIGAGAEMRAPMARAVIGGLITSTLLTLWWCRWFTRCWTIWRPLRTVVDPEYPGARADRSGGGLNVWLLRSQPQPEGRGHSWAQRLVVPGCEAATVPPEAIAFPRLRLHLDAVARIERRHIAPAAHADRRHEVLVQVVHVLHQPVLLRAAHRDVVEQRKVLHVLAQPHAARVRAYRHAELGRHQHHRQHLVHTAQPAGINGRSRSRPIAAIA